MRQELECSHKKSSQQLQSKVTELETSYRELTERRYKNESTIRDLKIKLSGLEEVGGGALGCCFHTLCLQRHSWVVFHDIFYSYGDLLSVSNLRIMEETLPLKAYCVRF